MNFEMLRQYIYSGGGILIYPTLTIITLKIILIDSNALLLKSIYLKLLRGHFYFSLNLY